MLGVEREHLAQKVMRVDKDSAPMLVDVAKHESHSHWKPVART
jgi:hypothetical protein